MPKTNYLTIEQSPHLALSFNDHARNLRPLANMSHAQLKAFLAFLSFHRVILIDQLEKSQTFLEVKETQGAIAQLDKLSTDLIRIHDENKKEK